jgi:hypothetical protein
MKIRRKATCRPHSRLLSEYIKLYLIAGSYHRFFNLGQILTGHGFSYHFIKTRLAHFSTSDLAIFSGIDRGSRVTQPQVTVAIGPCS